MLLCDVAVLKTQVWKYLFTYINFKFPRPELRILPFFFFFLVVGLVYCSFLECCIDMSPLFGKWQCFFSPDLCNLHKPFNRIITECVLKFNVLECLEMLRNADKIFVQIYLKNIQPIILDTLHVVC